MIPATPAHAEALALLHAASFPTPEQWPASAFRAQLALPTTFGFLTPAGGLVLARAAAGEAELLTLAVHPHSRRRGLAQALLAAILAESTRRGATALFLEVADANIPARALYSKYPFTQVGRRRDYYAPGIAALILRHPLTPAAATIA